MECDENEEGDFKCEENSVPKEILRFQKSNELSIIHHRLCSTGIIEYSCGQFIQAQTKWQRANMIILEGDAVALLEVLHFADANRWDGLSLSVIHLL
ncbi:hypothetical protein MTR_1g115420 [Medicago truncatula]|uniref:Uncharacterized protein n=1 Tax=Medicago truncatula TaxID=3880 RepID=A0A072VRT6_MEDTR|nr:hypothetical protein MTR_1g115420 [Medicago truncatula]